MNEIGKTVLLATADPVIARSWTEMLRGMGFSVISAPAGDEVVGAVANNPDIAVVIMDAGPGDSVSNARAADAITRDHDIPVVFLAGNGREDVSDMAAASFSCGYAPRDADDTCARAILFSALRLHDERRRFREREGELVESLSGLRKAEEALARSEAKFRAIYEQASHLAGILDLDGTLLEANRTARSFIGADRESYIGKPYWETPWWAHSAGDRELVRSAVRRAAEGEMFNFNTTHRDAENNLHYIEFTLKPVKDDSGLVFCLLAEGRDVTGQKNSELALIESETRLRAITSSARDAIIMVDSGDRIIFWNEAAERMLGYSRREALGRELHALIAPGRYREAYVEGIRLFSKSGRGIVTGRTIELYALRRDGTEFPIALSLSTVQFGGEWHAVGIIRDITGLKEAEAVLREREETFRALAENSGDVIMRFDRECRHLYVNPAVERQTGIPPENFIGHTHMELGFPPELCSIWQEAIRGVFDSGSLGRIEFNVPGDGWVDWLLMPEFSEGGSVKAVITSARDITERKHMEESLRESERRYRLLIENAPMPVLLIDAEENTILYVNRRASGMLGIDSIEDVGLPAENLWAEPMARRDYLGVLTERGYVTDYEARLRTSSGQEFWALLSGSFTFFEGRRAIVTMLINITERKKVEEALASALSDNKALLRELQHRIKNSFSIITGLVGLEARRLNNPEMRDLLHELRGRIVSLANLYEILYRSHSVKTIQLEQYLDQLSTSVLNLHSSDLQRIRRDISFDAVRIDVKQAIPIGLILNELLTNVFKYAFPSGCKGTVRVRFKLLDGQGMLEVADDGAGPPAGFDIEHPGGTGLGLVKMLASQLKGTLSFESAPETVFRIVFPMR